MDVLDGITVKGYELGERIGAGGFGVVYRAFQSTVGREVAVKVILPGFSNHPEFIRRFESEARMVARLEHLHIVPLYDYWRDPEGAYLVMRLMRGGNLRGLLAKGGLELEAVAQLLDQVTAALAVAHRNEVIHRDIKPANILLDEDNNAYLSDFGIAKDLEQMGSAMTAPDGLVGSPDYLSPEQARLEEVTPQTDIYSLGVVLYEMLVGDHPFPGLSPVEQLFKHINEDLPEITGLDPEVNDAINHVVHKATSKNPQKRYEDVLAFAFDFHEAAALTVSQVVESLVELLTPREQEVLKCIVEGKTNREIAEALTVELPTVKWYVRQIYRKLNVRSRVQAIVRARELNLIVDRPRKGVGTTGISRLPEPENPYKGLRAFQITDEQDFFGRDRLKARLIERLCERGEYSRFLAVVGPSGSGKSSLVKAGLIPALWRGELPGSEKWYIVDMMPGAHPLDELEVALTRIAADQTINLQEHLRRDTYGLQRIAKLILPDDPSELLLVIDQFEEVFTLVPDEETRTHFLDLLYAGVTDPRSRVRVVITLRADFYDRPLHYPGFGELVRERMETVLPLSAEELEQAIARPANRVGVGFEEGLVAHIIDEVLYQPGALPLLQYSLTELFEVRTNRKLTQEGYQSIGGAVGALAKRAEEVYAELDAVGHACVQQMFLRLVTLGEGTEDTRRRVPRSELLAVTQEPDVMDEIIDTYAAYRLLSLDHDPATRSPMVEVAHEAILREWERLGEWLNAARDDIRLQRQLAIAAEGWRGAEQDTSYLLRGSRLKQFETWEESTEFALTPRELEYLGASLAEREREEAAEAARQAHEVALEKRSHRFLQGLVGIFLIAAVVSAGLAIFAFFQRQDALRQASIGLAAQSMIELEGEGPERAVLLALEALEHYPYTPQAEAALGRAVQESRPYTTIVDGGANWYTEAVWSPDGKYLATSSTTVKGEVYSVWEVETARESQRVSIDVVYCMSESIDWSPGGDRLVTSRIADPIYTECNAVEVWDTTSGGQLLRLDFPQEVPPLSLDWSPDGRTILVAIDDGTVRALEAETLIERQRVQVAKGSYWLIVSEYGTLGIDVAWSPNGDPFVTAAWDGLAKVWNGQTYKELLTLTGHTGGLTSAAWSPDGEHIATASEDGTSRIWDATTGEALFSLSGHTGMVRDVAWSPDGRRIATAGADKTVRIWQAATGEALMTFHWGYRVWSVDWSTDGEYLAVRGDEVRILDLTKEPLRLNGHTNVVWEARYSPDGVRIATLSVDGTARIWDASTGEELLLIDANPGGGGCYLDWSPDGKRLVTTGGDGPGKVWDAITGDLLFELPPTSEGNFYCGVGWSTDGSKIGASSALDSLAVIFDASTGEIITKVGTGDCFKSFPRWSPDRERFATGCCFTEGVTPVYIWDDTSGELLMELDGSGGNSYLGEYSPDGTRIAIASWGKSAMVRDANTGELLLTFVGHTDKVYDVAWSPDGERIASGASGEVKVWDASTGAEVLSYQVPGDITQLDWSPDGKSLVVTGQFNTPVVMPVWTSTEDLIDHAYECCVQRELTPDERVLFGLPEG
jgi:WD40 repeat protein/serine/threonine protein kinase